MAYIMPNKRQVGWENLSLSYSSSTLSVTSANGSPLSTANPGYVTLPANSGLGLVTIPITADQGFIDDTGASEIVGNLFGLITGIAHGATIPFALYAVLDDSDSAIAFMCSRRWGYSKSPSLIGTPSSAIADTLQSMFAFESVTAGDYDGNPCLQIGSFQMTMSASDDWTVYTAQPEGDGVGCFQEGKLFLASTGQFGNSAGSYFQPAGGTAPIFTTQFLCFYVDRSGKFDAFLQVAGATTVGAGAVPSSVGMPYMVGLTTAAKPGVGGYGQYFSAAATPSSAIIAQCNTAGANQWTLAIYNSAVNRFMLQTDWTANSEGYVHMHGTMRA